MGRSVQHIGARGERAIATGNLNDPLLALVDGKFVAMFHLEGGKENRPKVVRFQVRPDPLAR
ncbi:MAG TPA: hypothetical protein VFB75_18335 [Burkholderiales bacterium]|nr:hypothetical protein [Burkholderiales bacterium]